MHCEIARRLDQIGTPRNDMQTGHENADLKVGATKAASCRFRASSLLEAPP